MKSEDNTLVMDRTMAAPGGGRREDGLTPGDVLGQYRIVRSLGRGGMGEAYEAEHQVLRRRYALKLLHRGVEGQGVSLERFQLEAQVMANLEHPNIIRVDDFGETAGRFWLRMELAEGLQAETTDCQPISLISLKELADAHQGRLPQDLLLTILRQVLAGLDYAHHHGAVHRDIKPANILFQRSVVKIADFGLVKLVGEEWIRSRAEISVRTSLSLGSRPTMQGDAGAESGGTSTRALLGTYEYMSPEQKQGGAADARSDLYAVGVMAYRLLTGRNIGPKAPSRIAPSLAPAWDDFVEQALEENPEERLSTAADALRLLDAVEAQIRRGGGGVDQNAAAKDLRERRLPNIIDEHKGMERRWRKTDTVLTSFLVLFFVPLSIWGGLKEWSGVTDVFPLFMMPIGALYLTVEAVRIPSPKLGACLGFAVMLLFLGPSLFFYHEDILACAGVTLASGLVGWVLFSVAASFQKRKSRFENKTHFTSPL